MIAFDVVMIRVFHISSRLFQPISGTVRHVRILPQIFTRVQLQNVDAATPWRSYLPNDTDELNGPNGPNDPNGSELKVLIDSVRLFSKSTEVRSRAAGTDELKDCAPDFNGKMVSIIIPTCDRKDSLKAALDSVAGLDYPRDRYEVLVVDDGSVDGTEQLVRELQARVPIVLRYFRQEKKGLSAAKNVGIRESRGEILVFTDDDCLLEKEWLALLVKPFDSPGVGVVGGPDRIPEASGPLATCIDYSVTSFIGTGGVREGGAMRLAKYYPRGCNTAMLKSVVEKVGGFDENFRAGEDIELVYRVKRAGYSIAYASEAFVWHKRRASFRTFLRQIFSRGYWRAELGRRHRELLELSYLLPSLMIVGFVSLFLVSFVFPLALIGLIYLAGIYLLALFTGGILGAIRIRDLRALFLIPLLLALQHFTYGLGFLTALIRWKAHA